MAHAHSIAPGLAGPSLRRGANAEAEGVGTVDEACFLLDGSFQVADVNETGLHLLGQSRADVIGRSIWDLAPQLKESPAGLEWKRAVREASPVSTELAFVGRGGGEARLTFRARPSGDGLALSCRASGRQRVAEESLAAQAELVHASRLGAMGMMAGALAHELAQPLTSAGNAVAAGLALLDRQGDVRREDARDALELARGSIERANALLRRVRAFVAKGEPRLEVHRLETVITDAALLMYPETRLAGVEMRVELDRSARWIEADPVQIQQVLTGLIKNAIDAMSRSDQRCVTVSTTARAPGEIEIRVEDGGPGRKMAPEELFACGEAGGHTAGIGLAICRAIVQAHGGTLRADRSPAGGASFTFTLPAAAEPAPECRAGEA